MIERTSAVCNPQQLESEIRAIPGFVRTGITVYRTIGQGGRVLIDAVLTAGQEAQLDAVISAHMPDFTEDNEAQEQRDLFRDLKAGYAVWDSATATERMLTMKKLLRAFLLLVRKEFTNG